MRDITAQPERPAASSGRARSSGEKTSCESRRDTKAIHFISISLPFLRSGPCAEQTRGQLGSLEGNSLIQSRLGEPNGEIGGARNGSIPLTCQEISTARAASR